ncbi:MAG: nuclear transport factor 2 family protein [Pseudomonadales bacterium]
MSDLASVNKALGLRINKEIWNNQRYDLIPECFTEDFVADYSPRVVREGREQIRQMVESAHAVFEGFTETVQRLVADEQNVASGRTVESVSALVNLG